MGNLNCHTGTSRGTTAFIGNSNGLRTQLELRNAEIQMLLKYVKKSKKK